MFALGTGPAMLPVARRRLGKGALLSALGLSPNAIAEDTPPGAVVGAIMGKCPGSTLLVIDDAGGSFGLDGTDLVRGSVALNYEVADLHTITLRETHPDAANSPRDTVLTIAVTNVDEQPALGPLALSPDRAIVGQAATLDITGATPGSTIAASLPPGLVLDSAGRRVTGTPTTRDLAAAWTITETLADSPNSPRTTTGTLAIGKPLPVNTAPPVITGGIRIGAVLAASSGQWSGEPTAFAFQWLRGGVPIAGANSASYTLVAADGGKAIAVRVTASNESGGGTPATSAPLTAEGTTTSRYSFAGVGYRSPTLARNNFGANLYHAAQFLYSAPSYTTNNVRFFLPNFYSPTNAETANGNQIVIEAVGIDVGGTVYTQTSGGDIVGSDGSTTRSTFPITVPAGASGVLLDPIAVAGGIPGDVVYKARIAYNLPSGGSVCVQTPKVTTIGMSSQGGTTTQSGLVGAANYNTALTNLNSHSDIFMPMFAVAQGGDGRPAILVMGDSIGFGQNETTTSVTLTARGAFGFLSRGLDDNATTKRIAHANLACPGHTPQAWGTGATWTLKRYAVQAVNALCGAWPFDRILSEHGTNSISVTPFATMMQTYWSYLSAQLGGKPITQTGLLPYAGTTDSYATLGGQTVAANNGIGQNRWTFNDSLAAGSFSAWVDDFFEPWKKVSYDLTTNRDKFRVAGMADVTFATTLAAAFAGGSSTGTMSLNAAPTVGMALMWGSSTTAGAQVSAVSGSGPYSVTVSSLTGTLPAISSGTAIREIMHDTGGLHPSGYTHANRLAASAVEWKQAKGWV